MSFNLDEFIVPIEDLKAGKAYLLPVVKPVGRSFELDNMKRLTVEKINKNTIKFKEENKLYKKFELSNGIMKYTTGHYGSINAVRILHNIKV